MSDPVSDKIIALLAPSVGEYMARTIVSTAVIMVGAQIASTENIDKVIHNISSIMEPIIGKSGSKSIALQIKASLNS